MSGDTAEKIYRIGEAAELLRLNTHVLRYWESEFPDIVKPKRTEKGQRLYTETHLRLLRRIRQLRHEQGMTIEGVRRILEGGTAPAEEMASAANATGAPGTAGAPQAVAPEVMPMIREELGVIRQLLASNARRGA